MSAYLSGFSLGLSLILAIGSQNAFVIKQGIKKHYVLLICLLCATSDALLIALGVAGFGAVVQEFPQIETFARYGGAAFLLFYGLLSFHSAFTKSHSLEDSTVSAGSVWKTAAACLAFTWLNPHVYLDTVVLLGSISTQFEGEQLQFGLGAMTASFCFFFSLGYGARLLSPLFKKPIAWKILEVFVGLTMLTIAASLAIF
ncbi:LysE/ArgO family amino acid transporter [uncultured Endozoicomonas sp.]|uniref:LysE/ArgO family amino acid transporter n=1 Tax=uncultured Endozoicomonas sp. TaxID=432652 RepID=UPI0026377194|nr:LysE/ArgO family amino acid transporter [uncultured Endozoicomonas sp.]